METRLSPSMHELRALAAERGLKYYLHLSKPELFSLLQRKEGGGSTKKTDAVADDKEDDMHRSETSSADPDSAPTPAAPKQRRSSMRLSSRVKKRKTRNHDDDDDDHDDTSREKKKAKVVINTLDPIMFTALGPHTFEFMRTNGSVVVYNVETLVQYILATGDFSEPQTRIPFSDDDLRRIDSEAKKAKLDEKSVTEAKKSKHVFEAQKVKRDGLLGLERCASEFVNKMLEIVESEDPEEGEMLLIMSIFPSFSDIFEQIRRSDTEFAKHSMDHFKAFVKGPKNRPTVDTSGLLPVILGFLEDVGKGNQDPSAFGF